MSTPRSTGGPASHTTPAPRQKPGNACEACRRRKLRCDRNQPQCGHCKDTGEECRVGPGATRGPKKGHMKAMQARLAALEQAVAPRTIVNTPEVTMAGPPALPSIDEADWPWPTFGSGVHFPTPPKSLSGSENGQSNGEKPLDVRMQSIPDSRHDSVITLDNLSNMSTGLIPDFPPMAATPHLLPDLLLADRDQLYFDRVHAFVPVIDEDHYYSWANDPQKTSAQAALQHVMWTLASAASAQHQQASNSLYETARRSLEDLERADVQGLDVDIVEVQAWLLLALHELTRVDFRRGWLSAGHAFRLIQLMGLHELDVSGNLAYTTLDWVELEEHRRTFWLAYILDRIVSLKNGSPLTFDEHVITVRMPAAPGSSDAKQASVMGFLSDIMAAKDNSACNSLTRCVIMATLCGRALSHQHQSMAERAYNESSKSFWARHQWIHSTVSSQVTMMTLNCSPVSNQNDPLLYMASLMAHTTVLYMYRLMGEMSSKDDNHQAMMDQYRSSFSSTTLEITRLARIILRTSCFKTHPLIPILLCVCGDYLARYGVAGDIFEEQVQLISNALQVLKRINNLAQGSFEAVAWARLGAYDLPSADTSDMVVDL